MLLIGFVEGSYLTVAAADESVSSGSVDGEVFYGGIEIVWGDVMGRGDLRELVSTWMKRSVVRFHGMVQRLRGFERGLHGRT